MKTDGPRRACTATALALLWGLSYLFPGAIALAKAAKAMPSPEVPIQQVTVSYEMNLPAGTKAYQFPQTASYEVGAEVLLPTVDAGDYYELQTYGWIDTKTGEFYWSGQKVEVAASMTLVAQWRNAQIGNPVSIVRIKSRDGGTVSPKDIVQFKGKESPLVLTITPEGGYAIDTVTVSINGGQSVSVLSKLKAQGDAWTYTLSNADAYGKYYDIEVTFKGGADATPSPSATPRPAHTPRPTVGTTAADTPAPVIAVEILTQPQEQNVCEGEKATFTIAASGSEPITYQWQVMREDDSWEDIEGANANVYTTPEARLEQSGQRYRCIVRNQGRALASSEVKLTVSSSNGVPQTGQQGTSPWVWICLVAVGAAAVAVALLAGRKKR